MEYVERLVSKSPVKQLHKLGYVISIEVTVLPVPCIYHHFLTLALGRVGIPLQA
jgi:hypothetical protein